MGYNGEDILGNVFARLPDKDVARAAALASRWCGIWGSMLLILRALRRSPLHRRGCNPQPARLCLCWGAAELHQPPPEASTSCA
ncbi:hypothetical protein E2562_018295 [Oryza meyeriana var. granulata]|uniref:F-box domain-containing protein n=1 Tax=Oryza meyeriana var. granulata TaxID=110450 RepID=A0A6G1CRD0_9ORYZ|nr:hypothetical protein E2562_018295 [Oryza meyeriana var. granulata]